MAKDTVQQERPASKDEIANKALGFGPKDGEQRILVGTDNFFRIRTEHAYYVDKTLLIKEFIETSGEVTLITRPRRFGKTLNMTMIREFFDITKNSRAIFEGLAIMQTKYADYINSRPVIYFSLKNCAAKTWPDLIEELKDELYNEYQRYGEILEEYMIQNPSKSIKFKRTFDAILDPGARTVHIEKALLYLTEIVGRHYKIKPILIIDEYDQPIMSSYEYNYHDETGDFFSNFYGSVMKGNDSLERALLTGVQRIAQESIFSKFNNTDVYTVLSDRYSQYFGLTEQETEDLLNNYGLTLNDAVRKQYNGYTVSNVHVYNPWSILNYAKSKVMADYWANTSSNTFIKGLLKASGNSFLKRFNRLIANGETEVEAVLETSYAGNMDSNALWGLLVNAGYLTAIKRISAKSIVAKIPNGEVMSEFKSIVASIYSTNGEDLKEMFNHLVNGEVDKFFSSYKDMVISCTSYMDATENSYHMLFLGMAMYLRDSYDIKSNLESGYGRFDIRMESLYKYRPHIMFEFKQGDEKELGSLSKEALQQIHDKKYYTGLKGDVLCIGIAHDKKRCEIAHNIYNPRPL